MLHRHDFHLPATRAPLPRLADAQPLTPADYIRLRREAAKLSQHDLAGHMASLYLATATGDAVRPIAVVTETMLTVVKALELPGGVARRPDTIHALAAVLPIDADAYFQLANEAPDRHPRICRGCGVSMHDPEWMSAELAWATPTGCTRCVPGDDQ